MDTVTLVGRSAFSGANLRRARGDEQRDEIDQVSAEQVHPALVIDSR